MPTFQCRNCGKEYTELDRKKEPFCECGARRIVSFGKMPESIPSEIRDYVQEIFEEAEKVHGHSSYGVVYEKGFILLALVKLMCSQENRPKSLEFQSFLKENKWGIRSSYDEVVSEFKSEGFRTPTAAMPGMAEDEMLGSTPNKLKITGSQYSALRQKLASLTSEECRNSIEFLTVHTKNKLYVRALRPISGCGKKSNQ